MAKTNKYTSVNFNHFYEKSPSSNSFASSDSTKPSNNLASSSSPSFSSPSYSAISSPKTHGRMLVLTRPTHTPKPKPKPKPITTPPPRPLSPQPQRSQEIPDQLRSESCSDHISLRPLGHTGTGSPVLSPVPSLERVKEVVAPVVSPKPGKFVPPHLRPGYVGREERPGLELGRGKESIQNSFGSPGRYGEDGRPKSGGGYEGMGRGGQSDLGMNSRPRSSGNRFSLSGWYCLCSISLFV